MIKSIGVAVLALMLMAFKPGDQVGVRLLCELPESAVKIAEVYAQDESLVEDAVVTMVSKRLCMVLPVTSQGIVTKEIVVSPSISVYGVHQPGSPEPVFYTLGDPEGKGA